MRFYLEQYDTNKERGLDALRQGNRKEARECLLQAARYLLMAARQSSRDLRETRAVNARRLWEIARTLGTTPTGAERSKPTRDDSEDGLTLADLWLVSKRPDIKFDDIAGLEEVKEALRLRVIYPFRYPDLAARFKKRAGGGILLYGPPGTGKTMIAKAIATELNGAFFNVKSSNIMSQWVGVAERNVAHLFEAARAVPIAIIFIDETEALVGRRGGNSTVMNRVVPQFLSEVDGLEKNQNCILLIGATNRPWDMDEAALRVGRFSEHFFVGLPDAAARERMLSDKLAGIAMSPDVDLSAIAQRLDGYSGADLDGICVKATDLPFERQIRSSAETVLMPQDLEFAASQVRPSVKRDELDRYRRFMNAR